MDLQSKLLRAEKAAGVSQVALGLAQELSEPLNRVRENLMVLRGQALELASKAGETTDAVDAPDATSPEPMSALFERTLEMLLRMHDIVRNLRDFAHADEFFTKPISISPALEDVASMVRRLAETKAVELQLELGDVPQVTANTGKLKKVVLHLLVNAIDAVERRGTVALRSATDGGSVVIEVQDDGPGINESHLPHIFEPFYGLRHPADRKLGLGLAISDAIIREHGGSLTVASTVGRGTTFTIRLPALPQQEQAGMRATAVGA